MIDAVAFVLMCNAVAAFFTTFYVHVVLLLRLRRDSDDRAGVWGANSRHANLNRFFAGEIYTDLKSKWSKSLLWVVVSFMALFAFGGIVELAK